MQVFATKPHEHSPIQEKETKQIETFFVQGSAWDPTWL